MFQTVTAASPTPMVSPARSARGPVNTTITALTTSSTMSTSVRVMRSEVSFHTGRPSGRSYTALEARMKAAT
jgi:hypothetical protein